MTRRVLDHNPLSGVTTYFDYEQSTDRMVITESQDVSAIIDANAAMRNDEDRTKQGIKDDHWHYARIPDAVLVDIRNKYGVKFEDKNDLPKLLKIINTDYPYLKTTHLNHTIKHA